MVSRPVRPHQKHTEVANRACVTAGILRKMRKVGFMDFYTFNIKWYCAEIPGIETILNGRISPPYDNKRKILFVVTFLSKTQKC